MIKYIKVNNFKSLINFEMELSEGINVLVGPNGSGKTNIISVFEFIANFIGTDIWKSVSDMGGAGSIFAKTFDGHSETMYIECQGCCLGNETESKKEYIYYKYIFEIKNSQGDPIRLHKQRVYLKTLGSYADDILSASGYDWDFDIEQTIKDDGKQEIKINKLTKKTQGIILNFGNGKDEAENSIQMQRFCNQICDPYTSLISSIRLFSPGVSRVWQDIKGGKVYNIIPSRAKSPDDAATPFGIAKDGSGLASTLYRIKIRHPIRQNNRFLAGENGDRETTLEQIVEMVKIANSNIESIVVKIDGYDNKLRVLMGVNCQSYSSLLPLSVLSDGTVKWLCLCVALETSDAIFSIEEPENYMHPKMQGTAIDFIRSSLERRSEKSALLITTHSETLLNKTRPDEIVIVKFMDGKTIASRPKDIDSISRMINETGYGIGYFYNSGVLDD